jgi:hypothetical protein
MLISTQREEVPTKNINYFVFYPTKGKVFDKPKNFFKPGKKPGVNIN